MNIRDIQYFLAVAELGHFGQAAQQCHVSQPTLSGQIKKLEEEWGVQLFERTNRRVMLTECGTLMVAPARRLMQEVQHMHEIAQHSRDPLSGNVRLAAFHTLAPYLFAALVPALRDTLPNIRLILSEAKTDALLAQLHQGEIDAALLALPVVDDFLMSQPLFDDPFMVAVPTGHSLAQHAEIQHAMLQPFALLLLEDGHCLRNQALEVCQLHNIAQAQDVTATSMETLRQMVKAGTGITLMPHIACQRAEEGICYIPFAPPAPKRTIGLVWRKTTPRHAIMAHISEILAHLKME